MAEIVILLAIKKIGIALANEAADQASMQFAICSTQLLELQGRMGRVARELGVMHDDVCQVDINNKVYEHWLQELQKVAHETVDMVDEYSYLVGRQRDIGCCFHLKKGFRKPRSPLSLNLIAYKVKEIERNLADLSELKTRWVTMINNEDASNLNYIVKRSQDLANTSRSLDDEDLVGVDENSEKLKQWLADDNLEHSVIALVGMGGLGKTTLAANVYRKEREKFQCHAWVSISRTYSREEVLRNIINQLLKDKISVLSNTWTMDITCLEEILQEFLEQQKYLIILDDVWTPEAFDDLSRALTRNDKGSRLIITTRKGDVAALASLGHILTLEALPEDKAWDLFCKKAFPRDGNHECLVELVPLSKEIVNKCKGLPLVIVCIGALLRVREKTVEEWGRINCQLHFELINNSMLDHVRNILHLSFRYLPTHVKSCFLYCSLFPEGYVFKRKHLIQLWMAEGFIEETGETTLEEVAEGYLKELIDNNLLQIVERNSFGRVKEFKMHHILHELAVDLWQKIHLSTNGYSSEWSLETDRRRLVVHKLKMDIHQSCSSVDGLRAFIVLDDSMPSFTLLPQLCERSMYMTVLELSGLPIEKIPNAIGDLFSLRHLGLRDTKVKMLPWSVEKLSNLLTLDLFGSYIQELPRGVVKLKNLRHLFAEKINNSNWRSKLQCCSGMRIPNGLGKLTNLQTLQALEAEDESVRYLGELKQLRNLRLWNVKGIHCRCINESLTQMQYLSNLHLSASDDHEVLFLNVSLPNLQKLSLRGRLAEGGLGAPLFQAVGGQNLFELALFWSQLREDPLPSLSRFSNLTRLHFTRAYNGKRLAFLTGWFPKLKVLCLRDLINLNQLEIQEGAMVRLEELYLVNLNSMTEVPPGIEFLVPLQYLGFYEISSDFFMLLCQCSAIRGMQWLHTLRH